MTCLTARDLGSFQAHALDEPERTAASAHIEGCDECRTRRESLTKLLSTIGAPETPAELAPRPETWGKILAAIRDDATPQVALAVSCSFCKGRLARVGAVYCAACLAPHHEDCWDEHGACSSCHAVTLVRPEARIARPVRATPVRPFAIAGVLLVAGLSTALVTFALRDARFERQQRELAMVREWATFMTDFENQKIHVKSQIGSGIARMKDHDPTGALGDLKEALGLLDGLPRLAAGFKWNPHERPAKFLEERRADLAALRRDIWKAIGDAWQMRDTDEALAEALRAYGTALEHEGKAPEALVVHLGIAQVQAKLGRTDDALATLGRILERDPAHVAALLERGRVWVLRGQHRAAITDFTAVCRKEPASADAYLLRGRSWLELHEPAKAKEDFEKVLERRDSDWLAYIGRCRARMALGDFTGAADDATEAIDLQPSYPDGHVVRADLFFAQEKLAEAMKDYEVAITRSATCWEAYLGLGRVLEWQLDFEGAERQYDAVAKGEDRAAAALRPAALAAKANLVALRADRLEIRSEMERAGRIAGRVREPDELEAAADREAARFELEARRGFDWALHLSPRFVPALVGRARLALARGEVSEARTDLAAATAALGDRPWVKERTGSADARDPELGLVQALLGRAALRASEWDEAVRRFDAAVAADGESPFAVAGLAMAHRARGETDRARALLARAHSLEDRTFDLRQGREEANGARRSKKPEKYARARWSFTRAIAQDSYHALAFLERGRLAAAWKAWDHAIADASRALEIDPDMKGAYELRGRSSSDRARAIADWSKVLDLDADPAEKARALLGRALARVALGDGASLDAARADVVLGIATIPADLRRWIEDERTPVEDLVTAVDLHVLHARILELANDAEGAASARERAAAVRKEMAFVAGGVRDAQDRDVNGNSVHNQGKALRDKRQYTDAIARFDRALALDPELADAYYDRGSCYLKIGNFTPGILDFSKALELNPRFADQFYNKAYQVSYVTDLNRVITELNLIVADHPDESHVLFLRGFFYVAKTEFKRYDMADLDDGIRDFDRTLTLNPEHVSAYIYRGFLYYKAALIAQGADRQKNFETAMKNYELAAERDPKSGIAHFLMAMVWSVRSEDADIDEKEKTARRDMAVKELTISIEEKEFMGFDRIKNDRSFTAVKDDPRVLKLIQGK